MRGLLLSVLCLVVCAALPATRAAGLAAAAQSGDLGVFVMSEKMFGGVAPGDSLTFGVYYTWDSEGRAPNARVTATFDPSLYVVDQTFPEATSSAGGTLIWDLGNLDDYTYGYIAISGIVPSTAQFGTEVVLEVTMSADVTDDDMENNTASLGISIEPPAPDLFVFRWGLLEELEDGIFWAAEIGVPTTFNIYYFNWSTYEAEDVVLTDSLPEGVEFISAVPEPTSVDGQIVTWEIGHMEMFGYGEITMRVRPTVAGNLAAVARISTSSPESDVDDNESRFTFDALEVLPPRLLRPHISPGNTESPAIVAPGTGLQGLARAGAKVRLYEGPEMCFGQLSSCATAIDSTVAAADRTWSLPLSIEDARDYNLYLEAELNGAVSTPSFGFYTPYVVRIDSVLDKAGFDLAHFTLQTDNMTATPHALGGSSGLTPDEDWTLNIRQEAPDAVATDPNLLKNHELRLEVFDGDGQHTEVVPPTRVEKVTGKTDDADGYWTSHDFIYVQKGFGPGSRVEIWCLPVYYTDDGLPIVGLVYVKCHEMLIDPAGYVYDVDVAGSTYEWPSVPPEESLIDDATVTALRRTGDDSWERWDAESSGQVNPQVTDASAADRIDVPGYYAFYVPAGQYQVQATAPGYADYVSPILTVVDAPVFHNVGMRPNAEKTSTGVEGPPLPPGRELPDAALLHQNYPNPFNPSTTISYALLTPSEITLTVHNLLGQEVARLVQEVQQPGMHHVRFDAGDLKSGVYFYRLQAGKSVSVRKMTLVR